MNQVLVLGGMTATGKSELAIQWAQAFNGEIISVDSVGIYRQLNIASAKLSPAQQQGVVHHGIDVADISTPWSVKEFVDYARQKIDEIQQRNKLPILVGGSGLYLKAILYDYEFEKESEVAEGMWDSYTNAQLYALLMEVDPQQAAIIHPNNRKRVMRALTIAKQHKLTKSEIIAKQKQALRYDALIFVLDGDRKLLHERIEKRVDTMLAQGLQAEVKRASQIASWTQSSMAAIGVKEWQAYFNETATLETTIETIKTKTRQFSKRQRTWFKHQFDGIWLDFNDSEALEATKQRIKSWILNFQE